MGDSSLSVISSAPSAAPGYPPIPPAVAGINVNFCKNPVCVNFGVPADLIKFRRKAGTLATAPGTAYSLTRAGRNRLALRCMLCGEAFSLKSNLAVAEELTRFARYLVPIESCCPGEDCSNHRVAAPNPKAYQRFGLTTAGTPRYRCKACQRTFAVGGRALKRQRITHLNKTILLMLVNKMPIRRIAKVTELNAVTLYGKIDFLHRQCLVFAAAQERALLELDLRRLYISVDRQDYTVNWSRDTDRRNVVLHAVGSADNTSGYVFAMNLNFDPEQHPETVEEDAVTSGDVGLPYPYRTYARLWLSGDYADAQATVAAEKARTAAKAAKGPLSKELGAVITDAYDAAAIREDSEASELQDEGHQKLPESKGMQVHEEYSLYGHFQFLKNLLCRVEKLRFFMDQDSGMRASCFAAFAPDIASRRVDAFFVRLTKDITVDSKRAALTRAKGTVGSRFN
jgi:transposase-like protein